MHNKLFKICNKRSAVQQLSIKFRNGLCIDGIQNHATERQMGPLI